MERWTSQRFRRALRLSGPYLQLALAGGLLAALVLRVDAGELQRHIGKANLLWLPPILAANFVSDWFRAVRWQHLLSPISRPRVSLLFAAAQVGSAVGLLLPLRAGEAVCIRIVCKRTGLSVSTVLATVFSEKLADLGVFAGFITIGLLLVGNIAFLWPLSLAFGALTAVGIIGGNYLASRLDRWPERAVNTGRKNIGIRFRREIYRFATGFKSFRDPSSMFNVGWSSFAAYVSEAFLFYASGQALGLGLSPWAYLLVVVGANIASALPITQAGIGVFEVTATGMMVALGVDEPLAAAYAIFVHILLSIPHVISGPLAALFLRISHSEIR